MPIWPAVLLLFVWLLILAGWRRAELRGSRTARRWRGAFLAATLLFLLCAFLACSL